MSIIVSNCQHCDEQQFQTLSCVHYTIFSVVKLDLVMFYTLFQYGTRVYNKRLYSYYTDLFIRALLLDRIIALEKAKRTPRIHLFFLKQS